MDARPDWHATHRIQLVPPMLAPILEAIAHIEGIPDSELCTLFLVNHHVFTYNDEKADGNGNVIIGYLVGT